MDFNHRLNASGSHVASCPIFFKAHTQVIGSIRFVGSIPSDKGSIRTVEARIWPDKWIISPVKGGIRSAKVLKGIHGLLNGV